MRKVDDGEEKEKRKRKKRNKIMTFIVATNVIASRPTGTPHARAKSNDTTYDFISEVYSQQNKRGTSITLP